MPALPRVTLRTSARSSGALDERERDPVGAGSQRRIQILAILVGQRAHRNFRVGNAHALAVGDLAADFHHGDRVGLVAGGDTEANLAVVDEKAVAGFQRLENLAVGQMHTGHVARRRIAVEGEAGAVLEHRRIIGEGAHTQLGTLQVGQNADRTADLFLDPANHLHQRVEAGHDPYGSC